MKTFRLQSQPFKNSMWGKKGNQVCWPAPEAGKLCLAGQTPSSLCFQMAMSQERFYIFKWVGKKKKSHLGTHKNYIKFKFQSP